MMTIRELINQASKEAAKKYIDKNIDYIKNKFIEEHPNVIDVELSLIATNVEGAQSKDINALFYVTMHYAKHKSETSYIVVNLTTFEITSM